MPEPLLVLQHASSVVAGEELTVHWEPRAGELVEVVFRDNEQFVKCVTDGSAGTMTVPGPLTAMFAGSGAGSIQVNALAEAFGGDDPERVRLLARQLRSYSVSIF
jgi:hypothetical protein